MRQMLSRLLLTVRCYATDNRGIAAVEFGMIVPFLLILFLGSIEYSRATMYARRFNMVTATTSDLVAREYLLDSSDMNGIKKAVETIWDSFDNKSTLQLEVLHVRRASDLATKKAPGQSYSEWSYNLMTGVPTKAACQDYALPVADMIAKGNSVVVVNGTYTYKTLFGLTAPGITAASLTWNIQSSHAPRDLCVAYNKPNCVTTCE